ncbi:MAG: HYR domain-containing protein, partial [Flavobacteriaceae bacterium]|nr:HYR domain-containing protein [Flavobacteriaceae bacterium]
MKKITITLLMMLMAAISYGQAVFINELHYDNSGGDVGEFVEIAGPAGTDLTGWTVELYNGSNGSLYNTINLSGTIDDEGPGYGALSFLQAGIQNGAPDGLALIDNTATVVQFLSYEGAFTAISGTANGMTSTDIGVAETSGTPVGSSLQLTGTGNMYGDFIWNAPSAESPGDINAGQTFSGGGAGSPPDITCPMDVVADNLAGTCGATVFFPDAIATDPDGDLDMVFQSAGMPSGSVFPVGVSTIQFTATDLAGNASTCEFTITVNDTEDPVAVCQDITVEVSPITGEVTVVGADLDNGSSDNCGAVTFSIMPAATVSQPSSLTNFNNVGHGQTFTATEDGNLSAIRFYVDGNSSGRNVHFYNSGTGSGINGSVGTPDYTETNVDLIDSAGGTIWTEVALSSPFPVVSGNQYSFVIEGFTDIYYDFNDPYAGGSFIFNYDLSSGCCTWGDIAFEADIVQNTFDCSDIGVNPLTLVVTDSSGNTATCAANVTVEDTTAPEIVCIGGVNGQIVFINEIHYDNTGADQDEAIEIAGPAGTDLSTFSLVLYNGNGGAEYNNVPLSGTIDDEGNGYGAVNFPITGVQNGSPDGIVLAENGNVIQFLSYEGSFTAVGGIADGMVSTDIGVSEGSGTPIGESLQLTGTGNASGDFVWNAPMVSTPGDINTGQTFMAPTSSAIEVDLDANGMATINASDLLMSASDACGWTATVGTAGTPESLETTFAGGNSFNGNMFDINALNDITVDSFDVNIATGTTDDIEVWFKTGSFVGFETDPGPWTLLDTAVGITSAGDGVPTPLN